MPTVKSIDVYTIEARLRKDKTKEGIEVWQYINALKSALAGQQDLSNKAIAKIRELSKELTNIKNENTQRTRS